MHNFIMPLRKLWRKITGKKESPPVNSLNPIKWKEKSVKGKQLWRLNPSSTNQKVRKGNVSPKAIRKNEHKKP
jgi:hypothetical protein